MMTFAEAKSSPKKSEAKNASLAMKSRQQVINEVNKRRTILQDNSWIKKQPEVETADENYGRVVLNQYKSQDSLHRNADEKDEQKSLLSRYRSDTTLNRISEKNNADKMDKASPTLDYRPGNSKECIVPGSSDNASSPVKKKRQSWMPPPVTSQKPITDNMEHHKRQSWPPSKTATAGIINHNKRVASTSEKLGGPKINLDELIKVKRTSNEHNKGNQDLDTLIQVTAAGGNCEKGSLDNLIKVKSASSGHDKGTFDDLIQVKPTANGYNKGSQELGDLIVITSAADQNRKRSQELDDLIVITSAADQNRNRTSEQDYESVSAPDKQSDRNPSCQVTRGSSKFPHDAYEDNSQGRSIKTIYSTADRAVIEKEMCTYCRKPLGTDTKMILDALQICCHATCFQCEVCKGPLENLKAGDSIWIYKNTVHCESCYSKVKVSWIY